jgi:DNA repair protein RadC
MGDKLSSQRHANPHSHAAYAERAPKRVQPNTGLLGLSDIGGDPSGNLWPQESDWGREEAEAELLATLLAQIDVADSAAVARSLIFETGSLGALLFGDPDLQHLPKQPEALQLLSLIRVVVECALRERIDSVPVLSKWEYVRDYLFVQAAFLPVECFRVLYLNSRSMLIRDEAQGLGTVDCAPVFTRLIVHRALNLGAAALILVHNHPSGISKASRADINITREIVAACAKLNIAVHDHIIVTRTGLSSMRGDGLL